MYYYEPICAALGTYRAIDFAQPANQLGQLRRLAACSV
jgi:hypothetical protein